jgi:hypothetical protein
VDDSTSQYTDPTLFTSWEIEKHGGFVYTHEFLKKIKKSCYLQGSTVMSRAHLRWWTEKMLY